MLLVGAALVALSRGQAGAQQAIESAPDFKNSGLLIYDVWVRPTAGALPEDATPEPPLSGMVTGAFMTIENTGDADYQLVGIASDAAGMTHIHETTTSGSMSGMRMIRAIDLLAGETVRLESGGYHAMLMNLTHDIRPGEAVVLVLTFANGDGATFDVTVAGIASDLPPERETLIAANALGRLAEEGSANIALILDNRDAQPDSLIGIDSVPAAQIRLFQPSSGEVAGFTRVELPASEQTLFAADRLIIRLEGADELPGAVLLMLTFASGRELTVAVPIIEVTA